MTDIIYKSIRRTDKVIPKVAKGRGTPAVDNREIWEEIVQKVERGAELFQRIKDGNGGEYCDNSQLTDLLWFLQGLGACNKSSVL